MIEPPDSDDGRPGDDRVAARARAREALRRRERRDLSALSPLGALPASASALAREQLRLVAEFHGERPDALVIDLERLRRCRDREADSLRAFTGEILARRGRSSTMPETVLLRRGDVDALSTALCCPPDAVTPTLDRLGLLA